jgi:hypothetical protein
MERQAQQVERKRVRWTKALRASRIDEEMLVMGMALER